MVERIVASIPPYEAHTPPHKYALEIRAGPEDSKEIERQKPWFHSRESRFSGLIRRFVWSNHTRLKHNVLGRAGTDRRSRLEKPKREPPAGLAHHVLATRGFHTNCLLINRLPYLDRI